MVERGDLCSQPTKPPHTPSFRPLHFQHLLHIQRPSIAPEIVPDEVILRALQHLAPDDPHS